MKPLIVLLIVIGVGVLAFFGGVQYDRSKQTSVSRSFMTGAGRTGGITTGMRRVGSNQPISGEILNMDNSSITVKLTDGSSRIILLSDKTIFSKTTSVDKTELKVGEKVGVFGTNNTDGSVSAQNVQLNPQFRATGTAGNNAATESAQ